MKMIRGGAFHGKFHARDWGGTKKEKKKTETPVHTRVLFFVLVERNTRTKTQFAEHVYISFFFKSRQRTLDV